ncbi:hypothetical protein V6N12_014006 [Hibiscus sabdariffa]|uniref:Uncharacterized protein n=1 Tax=Hibiscus sabdariffa TaxID=183260 RepID=A0ABR2CXR0_9ROSI
MQERFSAPSLSATADIEDVYEQQPEVKFVDTVLTDRCFYKSNSSLIKFSKLGWDGRESALQKGVGNWIKRDGGGSDLLTQNTRQANSNNHNTPEPPTDVNMNAILERYVTQLSFVLSRKASSSPCQVPASTKSAGDTESEESSSLR